VHQKLPLETILQNWHYIDVIEFFITGSIICPGGSPVLTSNKRRPTEKVVKDYLRHPTSDDWPNK
jgi:hypothetical protein